MKRIVTNLILTLAMMFLPALSFAGPVYANNSSSSTCGHTSAEKQVFSGVDQSQSSSSCDDSGVTNAIKAAVEILSYIVGVAAIIAIISGAFKYITSGGDSGKVGQAKSTLIYALIGLAIAVLAQLIVRFVITTANNVGQCASGQHLDSQSNTCVKN